MRCKGIAVSQCSWDRITHRQGAVGRNADVCVCTCHHTQPCAHPLSEQPNNLQEEALDKAKLAMGRAARRLQIVYRQSRSNLLLYVTCFIIVVVLAVYVLSKLYRLGRWIL
jgi:hypothetical protein